MYNSMPSNIVNNYANSGRIVHVHDSWNTWMFCNPRWVLISIHESHSVYITHSFFFLSMLENAFNTHVVEFSCHICGSFCTEKNRQKDRQVWHDK